jgi:hypothetical protein
MKTKFITFSAILSMAFVLLFSTNTIGYLTGAPSGKANDPASGSANCTGCHAGTATSNAAIANITTNIPATGYVPGTTYTITANVVYAGKTRFGFEVSPQNTSGIQKGTITITDPTNTKITSTKYVTHTSAGNTGSGSRSWSFNWTAPSAGTGAVGFYGSFIVGNNNGSESGDLTYTTSTMVMETAPCSITATITAPDTICTKDTTTLVASSTPTAASYLWNTGATTSTITGVGGTYTVTVTAPGGCTATATKLVYATPLKAPTGIVISTIKGTTATLTWIKANCATGYTLQYRPVGTTTWKTVQLLDTAKKNLTALLPLTTYELQMLSKIGTTVSPYSVVKTFTTLCLCNPETPVVTAPTSTSQTFTWTDDVCGVRYKLQYKKSTVTAWTTKIVGDTLSSVTLSSLALNTTYNYQFRRECNVGGTYYSTWVTGTFTTPVSIVTSTNELSKVVVLTRMTDLFGREVDNNYKDMVIYHYSDGSVKKGFIVK